LSASEAAPGLFSETFLNNDFHLLALMLAAVLRFGFGFLVIWPTTSTQQLTKLVSYVVTPTRRARSGLHARFLIHSINENGCNLFARAGIVLSTLHLCSTLVQAIVLTGS
jgi:hypothetical protein